MIDTKKWLRFELRAETSKTEHFEKGFCKEFFAIHSNISVDEIKIVNNLSGIENIPIHGLAFQSKYMKSWNWGEINKSLKQILNKKNISYPELEKVIIYVKEIGSEKLLKEQNKVDGILQKLKIIGVDVEFYDGWEIIWNDEKYEKLQEYFIVEKNLENQFLMIDKLLDNINLGLAEELLDDVKKCFEELTNKQKSKYFSLLSKFYDFRCIFEGVDLTKEKIESLLKSYNFNKGKNTLLNKAMGLYEGGNKKEAEQIITKLYRGDEFDEKIYGMYLTITKDNFTDFETFYKTFDSKYSQNSYIKGILGNIYFYFTGDYIKAYEVFYGHMDNTTVYYKKVEKFRLIVKYLTKKYGWSNLDSTTKKEFNILNGILDEVLVKADSIPSVLGEEILNLKAIVLSCIQKQYNEADYFFQKALEKRNNSYILLNKILNLLSCNKNEDIIIQELEKLIEYQDKNYNYFYACQLLIEQYAIKIKKIKNDGLFDLAGHFEKKAKKLLKILRNLSNIGIQEKRILNFLEYKELNDKKDFKKEVEFLLTEDNSINTNIIAYYLFGNNNYLESALNIYKKEGINKVDLIHLLDGLLVAKKDKDFFNLMLAEIKSPDETPHFQAFIVIGIELGESDKVHKVLEKYKNIYGTSYTYVKLKSFFEYKKGEIINALSILNNFHSINQHIDLLLWKLEWEYLLQLGALHNTAEALLCIGENTNFKNFSFEDKERFINVFCTINIEKSISFIYNFLQTTNQDSEQNLWVKIFFKAFFYIEDKKEYGKQDKIDKNSIIRVINLSNQEEYDISIDNTNRIGFGIDYVLDCGLQKDLLGKTVGYKMENILGKFGGINQKYKVIGIEHKYTFLQRYIFAKCIHLIGGLKINIPEKNGETDFHEMEVILDSIDKDIASTTQYVNENFINKGVLTFQILKHFFGKSYFDIYYSQDFPLLQANENCIIKKGDNIKSLILDASSLISIFEIGIQDIISNYFTLYVTQSTFNEFREILAEEKVPKQSETFIKNGTSGLEIIQVDKNFYQNRKTRIEAILCFIKNKSQIVGSELFLKKQDFIQLFGISFYQSMLLAQDKKCYLYSDERLLRFFGTLQKNKPINSFGSTFLIAYLLEKRVITIDEYLGFFGKIIDIGFSNIEITSHLIYIILIKGEIELLRKIMKYLKKINDKDFVTDTLLYVEKEMNTTIFNIGGNMIKWDNVYIDNKISELYNTMIEFFSKTEIDDILKNNQE